MGNMNKSLVVILTLLASSTMPLNACAQTMHEHSKGIDFASLDDGWVALEEVASKIHSAVAADNLDPLHDLAAELHAVADSFGKLSNHVPKANQLRFTSSVNQLRNLSNRLHMAYEQRNAAAAQQMVTQLNGLVQLLMAGAESS